MTLHVYAPKGSYLAQTRDTGFRRWATVPGKSKTAERAMVKAVRAMTPRSFRARVLFITEWHEPLVVMELKRT